MFASQDPSSVIFNWIRYLFAAVGLGMIVAGLISYNNTRLFISNASRTEGVVLDLVLHHSRRSSSSSSTASTIYKPLVSFKTAEGQEIKFLSSTGSNPPTHRKSEKVPVYYDSNEPSIARIGSFLYLWFVPSLLGGMGMVFLLMLGAMVSWASMGRSRKEALRHSGQRVLATIQRVESVAIRSSGNRHSFRVVCQWINPATSKLHVFRSAAISFDPGDHLRGNQITVFVDNRKPGQYLVDLSVLPELTK